ncbi:MAG: hypothetical protein ACK438_07695 [Flavobacteriales bacterium]|jgi:hypothetical protein
MKILSIFLAAALVKGCVKMADNGAAAAVKGVDNGLAHGIENAANRTVTKEVDKNMVRGVENGVIKAGPRAVARLTHEDSVRINIEATRINKEWMENLSLKEFFKTNENLELLKVIEQVLNDKPNSANIASLSQGCDVSFNYIDGLIKRLTNNNEIPAIPKALFELRDKLSQKKNEIEAFKKANP